MEKFPLFFLSAVLWFGVCHLGVAADPAAKTAKQAASEFGLSDSDLTLVPPELYDCIRHYASTGAKYMKESASDDDIQELKKKILAMRRASTKRFAARQIYATHPRFVLLRDASGMYHTVKFATLWTNVDAATTKDVSVDAKVTSFYAGQMHSPGDFDRSFLSRDDDGKIYLHEEMCTFDEEGAEPRLYDERFLLEELEGTWAAYLKGDVVVLRLGQAEAERRHKAQVKHGESEEPENEDDLDGDLIETLKQAAEISPEEKPKVETYYEELGCGPALLYVKRDAMLWIDSSRSVRFIGVTAER